MPKSSGIFVCRHTACYAGYFTHLFDSPRIYRQCLNAAVIGRLSFLGKEAAGDTLVMVPVVRYTGTAFSVVGAVK